MNIFYANCKHENWQACKTHDIFGLRQQRLPALEAGDIILLRVTSHDNQPYGVKAIWSFDISEKVEAETFVPWTDADYNWVVHCTPIIDFEQPVSEAFMTSSKVSQKMPSLFATRLMGSIGALKPIESISYLDLIIEEKAHELTAATLDGGEQDVLTYMRDVLATLQSDLGQLVSPTLGRTNREGTNTNEGSASATVVGERIELPILNYAPINEQGVVLLFGFYLKELGFSHLEEIRTGFPDAVGMRPKERRRLERVRIEFEFQSRNFQTHGHPVDGCDVIICWEDNWTDCPLEVIELKSQLAPE